MLTKERLDELRKRCSADTQALIAEIDRLSTPAGAASVLSAHKRKPPAEQKCLCKDRSEDQPPAEHRSYCPRYIAYRREQKRGNE